MRYKVSGAIAIPKASWGCAPALPNRFRVVFQGECFTWNIALREIDCIRFGRIASLSACVLFTGGCVVQIAYECFLDCSLLEVFCFQDGEQQILVSLRFQYHLINTFVKGDSLSPIFKGCLALLSLRDISPHRGESPSPGWASSTAVKCSPFVRQCGIIEIYQ